MIRKGTWIVILIFFAVLAVAFYLNKNPLPQTASLTPSATAVARILNGWQAADITSIEINGVANPLSLDLGVNGGWTLSPNNHNIAVDAGKAEDLRSQLAAAEVLTTLEPAIGVTSLGLSSPSSILIIKNKQGEQKTIKVGFTDPTSTGYYVQVNNETPVVVSKTTLDTVLDLLKPDQLLAPTPTPDVSPTPVPQGTPTPGALTPGATVTP